MRANLFKHAAGCSHALVWPWAPGAVRSEGVPALQEGAFLLAHLNEALSRTALLVQPLRLPDGVRRHFDYSTPRTGFPQWRRQVATILICSRKGADRCTHCACCAARPPW